MTIMTLFIQKVYIKEVDGRYLIQNPPSRHMEEEEMDKIASFPYQRDAHPYNAKMEK